MPEEAAAFHCSWAAGPIELLILFLSTTPFITRLEKHVLRRSILPQYMA
ncbi:hypothetical protein L21SP2_1237 [Salinispira pacifica]|uniref:Uncharacterized protein n=1 Tax=Salinispira pacifica TaxID=1307761 RepID=V5WFS7_9SPIO|nr:hypothetical protein L21SP2_1237 [Salinispira pacifica]